LAVVVGAVELVLMRSTAGRLAQTITVVFPLSAKTPSKLKSLSFSG
jgi:hypothetical protein